MLTFDRGTLLIDAPDDVAEAVPGALWDPRTRVWRTPAWRAPEAVFALPTAQSPWPDERVTLRSPSLRDYQRDAVAAWILAKRRGVIVLPTGAGKTRTAIAIAAEVARPTAILCPTRALVEQWIVELRAHYDGPIGRVSDGSATLGPITVLTFESAFRRMDTIGQRFALLIVDEVHHFGTGARAESLECSTAPFRLGLTATPCPAGSRIDELVGPTVHHVALHSLLGTALANFDLVSLHVALDRSERAAYSVAYGTFAEARAALIREHAVMEWRTLIAALGRSDAGRRALRGYQRALAIASLPSAKRDAARRLATIHRREKILVFAGTAEDAYTLGRDLLAPVISAETARDERASILAHFRAGSVRVLASARVLNEGIDVPDASVAIVTGGALGARELKQRIGRVLRPSPDKERATVYELIASGTLDERRANMRRQRLHELD
ncbi:DEAD/DEAH box helicase family protein [soil metagenome]